MDKYYLLMAIELRLVIMDEFIRKPSIDDLKCEHAAEQSDTPTEREVQERGPSPCIVHHRRHVEEDLEQGKSHKECIDGKDLSVLEYFAVPAFFTVNGVCISHRVFFIKRCFTNRAVYLFLLFNFLFFHVPSL